MAKKIPYLDGKGNVIEIKDDPKNPQIYFDPNDPSSQTQTNQSDAEGTDVNKIFAKYQKTGNLVDLITGESRQPFYGDFTKIPNFLETKKALAYIQQAFDLLPASTRNVFLNEPQNLIDFLSDPNNDAEAIKLGLKNDPDATLNPDNTIKLPIKAQPLTDEQKSRLNKPDGALDPAGQPQPAANSSGAPAKVGS